MNALKRIYFIVGAISCFIMGVLVWAEDAHFAVDLVASAWLFAGGIWAASKAMKDMG